MTTSIKGQASATSAPIRVERTFPRFTAAQRWEHAALFISVTVLLLTGLPQKYQSAGWSQWIISSPERLKQIQFIHHVFAVVLIAEVLYHLGHGLSLMARRRLPAAIFPDAQDLSDAWQMTKHLLFLSREKPKYKKYNFEQKLTYWFLFFAIGIMLISGVILWFPLFITRFLPGSLIPAAFLAHSNEAIAAAVFIVVWHFYHVHIERLNLSIFTGRLSEEEMRQYHAAEFERLTSQEQNRAENQGGSE